ncbi:polysaccharide pyruvyl transferase family protein [Psychrobacter sp. DM8]|uniref:polysaccharide pyruvyl transferase family protein n=1 Tax=Psychrobacter sp. DM8 TaxID=3440636 RepID=UPI003F4FD843
MSLPSGRRCFIFLAADYGNIGDIAISCAQSHYLKSVLPDYDVISIPISQTRFLIDSINKQIKANDIVTIIGGGNMGGTYPDIEALRQLVIKTFRTNRIICFPQTLDWNKSAQSKRALKKIIKVYSSHPDIHLFARESISFAKLNQMFSSKDTVKISLVPDIVMSATAKVLGATECYDTSGILRCLRDDKEAALTTKQCSIVDKALVKTGHDIEKTDTHAGGLQLSAAHCTQLLTDKLNQFRAANLVVTDRLHGMILSLLSGTPCLVLPNSNHKIRQTQADWLQGHPRIIFLELNEIDQISKSIDSLLSLPHGSLDASPVDLSKYNDLKKALGCL